MTSFVEELAKLSNPVPSQDPEDDIHEETRAQLVEKYLLDDLNSQPVSRNISRLKKQEDNDPKYKGKIISRKYLKDDDGDLGGETYSDIEMCSGGHSEPDDEADVDEDLSCGKDDYENISGSDDEDIDSDEAMGTSDIENDKFAPLLFKDAKAKQHTTASKEKDTKNQIKLWEMMLEIRIKLQKMISVANQLPQPSTYPLFTQQGGTEFRAASKRASKSTTKLQSTLHELQFLLLKQNTECATSLDGATASFQSNNYCPEDEMVKKLFGVMRTHRSKTLNYWYDKTRLSVSNLNNKSFSNFERPTEAQIEHVLSDRTRLIRRTQLQRSQYRVLGTLKNNSDNGETEIRHDAHLKQTNEEIFDDDDFYQQLLRQLIEQKSSILTNTTDSTEMTRQWLKLQRFHAKMKKVVDTKASKGRKIRYHVHPKLVSFMTPEDRSLWTHESRNQLVKSVFGQTTAREELSDIVA